MGFVGRLENVTNRVLKYLTGCIKEAIQTNSAFPSATLSFGGEDPEVAGFDSENWFVEGGIMTTATSTSE